MQNGGKRPGAGVKKGSKRKPYTSKSTREIATAAFDAYFLKRLQPLLESTEKLAAKPDARMVAEIWNHLKGKAAQSFELPTGSGIESVEVTYRIISKPDA